MKFTFDKIEERIPNEYGIQRMSSNNKTNGLLVKLFECYSWHYKLTISPDEILNTIACIYSKYVNHNSQKFRDYFTDSPEKKEISISYSGTFNSTPVEYMIFDLLEKVKTVNQSGIFEWLNVNFSTSSASDRTVRDLSVLSSQKDYYDYSISFCCGFPSVELLGTEQDWQFLKETILLMPVLDDEFLTKWRNDLVWLVESMLLGDEDFWQSGITRVPYGSGGQADYQGWVLILNPFNEGMNILTKNIKEKDILDLGVDIDVDIDDNGNKFKIKFVGGPTSIKFEDSFKVQNVIKVFKHEQGTMVEISR